MTMKGGEVCVSFSKRNIMLIIIMMVTINDDYDNDDVDNDAADDAD